MKVSYRAVRILFAAMTLVCCACSSSLLRAQKDNPACKDNPFLTRFPGTFVETCDVKPDDRFDFQIAEGKPTKSIEGKKNQVMYLVPDPITLPQVARNISTALRQANWTAVDVNSYGEGTWKKGGTWLCFKAGGGRYVITTVTLTDLTQEVTATAADLGHGIDATGHAVVPGILFDTGKAEVKDASKPALDEVAKLLSGNLKLKLWVVGHTDSVGSVASNLDLSKRRAAAVIAVLVSTYHIAPTRLDSFGNGPYAPVASNDTDEGRTQNRRVEIVKQ